MIEQHSHALFNDFPAISEAEWLAQVAVDLKSDTAFESLCWHTLDDFTLKPWYARESAPPPLTIPTVKATNAWLNCKRIVVNNAATANGEALYWLERSNAALEFHCSNATLTNAESLQQLLAGIDANAVALYFSGNLPSTAELLKKLASTAHLAENKGGLLNAIAQHENVAALFQAGSQLPNFRWLTVDTMPYHQQGATPAQEIAVALAHVSNLLHRATDAAIAAEDAAQRMEIIMAVGSSHFVELAKPRAFRYLLAQLLHAYGVPQANLPIALPHLFARTSPRNNSLLDPYTNVLRLTTEAISAILGGYDALHISDFDNAALSVKSDVAERITSNIHLILREEGNLHHVVDPAKGSRYIEAVTHQLIHTAWELFLAIEENGGINSEAGANFLADKISQAEAKRQKAVAQRKNSLIGVNRYTTPLTAEQHANFEALMQANAQAAASGNLAAPFEQLRLAMQAYTAQHNTTPTVATLMAGDMAISRRQAAFCDDAMQCGGFALGGKVVVGDDVEKSCIDVLMQQPAMVILCIAEKNPLPTAEQLCHTLRAHNKEVLIVMAGKPPAEHERLLTAGVDSFLYTGCNVLNMLESYQRKTGVQ
uniref:Heterodimeric methylmalonyl-CoA mutase small subunit n=1 Tax=Chlorobium chlorochromatii (strain CaD3) TaxID=340177 RepID=Q3AR91_CHLCH